VGRTALLAAAALVVNAFVWGLSWWPFRALQAQGLHSLWATALVYLLVAGMIVAWRPGAPLHLLRTRSLWPLFIASGVSNACFNWAVTIGDVIRVVLLFYLMPVWAALLARMLLGEPLRLAAIGRIALALAGAAVVLTPPGTDWPLPRGLADWLAIAGGAGFALVNVMLRREAAQPEAVRAFAMFAGGMVVAGGLAVVLLAAGTVAAPPAPAAGWLAGVLVLALMFGVGNLCLQYGAARLAANVTSLVLLTEVVFAAVSAVLIGGEVMTLRTVAGGAMIVAAAALAVLERPRAARPV
jgi:drug/metabolite transporter (DMT)-like permease